MVLGQFQGRPHRCGRLGAEEGWHCAALPRCPSLLYLLALPIVQHTSAGAPPTTSKPLTRQPLACPRSLPLRPALSTCTARRLLRRFTCPVQVGNSYRAAAVRARDRRCFDHNHYSKNNMDVRYAGVGQGES